MRAKELGKGRSPAPGHDTDSSRRRNFAIGFGLAVANTLIGAMQPVVVRYGALNLDPLLFCAGAAVVAALFAAATLHRQGDLGVLVQARYLPRLFMISMAGTVMTSLTLIFGFQKINAVAGVLLLQSEPVYSLLLATIVVGERPSLRQLAATAAIVGGIGSVFVAGAAFSPAYAAILVLLTPLFWQTAHVLSLRVMPPLSPMCITGARYIYAAFLLTAILVLFRSSALAQLADPRALTLVLATGFLIYFIGSFSWYAAISRLSLTWTTALVVPGIPMLSILFAVIFLGEHATAREAIGVAIAVIGIVALVIRADAHRKLPALEAAEAIHQPIS